VCGFTHFDLYILHIESLLIVNGESRTYYIYIFSYVGSSDDSFTPYFGGRKLHTPKLSLKPRKHLAVLDFTKKNRIA
jgi:hypothetical protein